MSLEDPLPDWVAGYFKVRIAKTSSSQQIELTCCVVETSESEKASGMADRFRVAILPLENPEDEKNLERWIAA